MRVAGNGPPVASYHYSLAPVVQTKPLNFPDSLREWTFRYAGAVVLHLAAINSPGTICRVSIAALCFVYYSEHSIHAVRMLGLVPQPCGKLSPCMPL
jgi:hypothetical protein